MWDLTARLQKDLDDLWVDLLHPRPRCERSSRPGEDGLQEDEYQEEVADIAPQPPKAKKQRTSRADTLALLSGTYSPDLTVGKTLVNQYRRVPRFPSLDETSSTHCLSIGEDAFQDPDTTFLRYAELEDQQLRRRTVKRRAAPAGDVLERVSRKWDKKLAYIYPEDENVDDEAQDVEGGGDDGIMGTEHVKSDGKTNAKKWGRGSGPRKGKRKGRYKYT